MLTWVETTSLAVAIRDSLVATALLSGLHVIGMTVAVGAVLVMSLRLTGRALADVPAESIIVPAGRGLVAGLVVSLVTGLLLVLPRVASAVENSYFQRKMLALLLAALFQWTLFRRLSTGRAMARGVVGVIDIALWGAVAVLGCMFTLVE